MTSLRLITLNSWKGDGAYRERLRAMIQGVKRLQPDILFLQEALLCPELGFDTAESLAESTGLCAVSLPLRRKPRDIGDRRADSWSGLAVLSRLPILSSCRIDLPCDPRDGERAAQLVELEVTGGRLIAANLHLTHLADGASLRHAQLAVIVRALQEAGPAVAALLAGDFNAGPDSLVRDGLIDCRDSLSVLPATTMAEETGRPDCLDHILMLPGSQLTPVRFWTDLGANPAEGIVSASDHLAVVVDFRAEL